MATHDGGTRPGYTVELATDAKSGLIVVVDAVNAASDRGQMQPMVEQIAE